MDSLRRLAFWRQPHEKTDVKLRDCPPLHLTYCLNVHPGERWEENFAAIRRKAMKVRDLVAPGRPRAPGFGLGLRLSREAAGELSDRVRLDEFRAFLKDNGLYVFTINGFPYGRFHGAAVKEGVYSPDWRTVERRDYTCRLADILVQLLPEGVTGSISTVPGSYKAWMKSAEDVRCVAEMLAETAAHLHHLFATTGRKVALALEPEPDCFIESIREAVDFLTGLAGQHAKKHLRRNVAAFSESQVREIWRQTVGVCLDTAHAAVEFEDPAECLLQLESAGVRVFKVQLSSALSVLATADSLAKLRQFCDPVYLHQVKARGADGAIVSYSDLPEALKQGAGAIERGEEWRIHFHVPLFFTGRGGLQSTSSTLTGRFADMLRAGATEHLEIETYTFDVLPDFLRAADVTESIAREYRWVLEDFLGR